MHDEVLRVARFRTELRRFLGRTDAASRQAGLTPRRYDLLLMIESAGGAGSDVRLTDLCDLLQLKQPAVTELVDRAVAAGLVERRRSSDDRRTRLLRLTPDGRTRLRQVVEALEGDRAMLSEALEQLGPLPPPTRLPEPDP